jgi:hypothetical protein
MKTTTIIGIDVGTTGAMSVWNEADYKVYDLPVVEQAWVQNQAKSLDVPAFYDLLQKVVPSPIDAPVVYVSEQMQAMGFKTPARILMGLSEMSAALDAAIRLFCLHHDYPLLLRRYQPRFWTKWFFGRTTDSKHVKTESLTKSRELFPALSADLKRQKDHNRAESLLLSFTVAAELSGCIVCPSVERLSDVLQEFHAQPTLSGGRPRFVDAVAGLPPVMGAMLKELEGRRKYTP